MFGEVGGKRAGGFGSSNVLVLGCIMYIGCVVGAEAAQLVQRLVRVGIPGVVVVLITLTSPGPFTPSGPGSACVVARAGLGRVARGRVACMARLDVTGAGLHGVPLARSGLVVSLTAQEPALGSMAASRHPRHAW